MLAPVAAFLFASLVTLWVIWTAHHHAHFSADSDRSGPQKFHQAAVPRIGGVAIVAGVLLGALLQMLEDAANARALLWLLVTAVPAFSAGLIEDLTKKVSPGLRLVASGLSGAMAAWLLGTLLTRTDIPGLDALIVFPLFALAVTVFVVAGVANAVNIIDGFNGLASMCVILMLSVFGIISYMVGDRQLLMMAITIGCAVMGFFVWNYPRGLIFLGDGGAYFLGFSVAQIGLLLVTRHPNVSPLVALMVCIYPVFETVFSIYRRRFLRAAPPGLPDGIHLHSLIYRRLVRWASGPRDSRGMTARNSAVAPYLWTLCLFSLAPALIFWDDSALLGLSMVVFALLYLMLYWRIVRFRTPGFMKRPIGLAGGASRPGVGKRPPD
jgi:UDP-N-acetylmuramyl pentapeptide phosphotransferase/UDP-N-acetylglucosamine-1-phosphate transferase